jgi:hypothetical protein
MGQRWNGSPPQWAKKAGGIRKGGGWHPHLGQRQRRPVARIDQRRTRTATAIMKVQLLDEPGWLPGERECRCSTSNRSRGTGVVSGIVSAKVTVVMHRDPAPSRRFGV